jgi:hypothetical protein
VQGETIQVQPSPLDVDAPTFTGFASLDDLALRLGFASAADLTAAQVAQGEMLLLAASGLIVDAVDRDDAWAAALTTVPAVLRAVCLEMVARVMQNPSGVRSQSETLGQHSRSASFTDNAHGLTLTDAEERMCRRTAIGATSGSAYVDSIITEMAPATSLAVLVEAGPNDPPVYDWTN